MNIDINSPLWDSKTFPFRLLTKACNHMMLVEPFDEVCYVYKFSHLGIGSYWVDTNNRPRRYDAIDLLLYTHLHCETRKERIKALLSEFFWNKDKNLYRLY